MADEGDQAAACEAAFREAKPTFVGGAAAIAARERPSPKAESALVCTSCGEPIPAERREAMRGTNICGDCARHLTRGRRGA